MDGAPCRTIVIGAKVVLQPPPMVLVARFGSLIIALDDRGLHVAVSVPRNGW